MAIVNPFLSIITLNVNGLKNQDLTVCCLQETYFRFKNTHRLKLNGMKIIFLANGKKKRAGVTTITADKIF